MAKKQESAVLEVRCGIDQVVVEVDPVDLGEVEQKTESGVIVPRGTGGASGPEPLTGVVVASELGWCPVGAEVVFDKIDGFRFEHGGMVLMALYKDHIRAIIG